jgi:hypothetical protein
MEMWLWRPSRRVQVSPRPNRTLSIIIITGSLGLGNMGRGGDGGTRQILLESVHSLPVKAAEKQK